MLALVLTRDVWSPFRLESLVDSPSRILVTLALAMGALQVISLVGYRAELFVLEALEGVDAVGIYSIANQAAESMWLIAAAIATAITAPVVRASEAEAVALVRRSLVRALLYTLAAGAVVAVTAPFVIRWALGDEFRDAQTPLCSAPPGAVAYAPVQILVVYLSVRRGRPRLSLVAGLVAMVVTVSAAMPLSGPRLERRSRGLGDRLRLRHRRRMAHVQTAVTDYALARDDAARESGGVPCAPRGRAVRHSQPVGCRLGACARGTRLPGARDDELRLRVHARAGGRRASPWGGGGGGGGALGGLVTWWILLVASGSFW